MPVRWLCWMGHMPHWWGWTGCWKRKGRAGLEPSGCDSVCVAFPRDAWGKAKPKEQRFPPSAPSKLCYLLRL